MIVSDNEWRLQSNTNINCYFENSTIIIDKPNLISTSIINKNNSDNYYIKPNFNKQIFQNNEDNNTLFTDFPVLYWKY